MNNVEEKKIVLREFRKDDWYALAGAESPSETQEPLIGDCIIDGKPAGITVDKNGIQFITPMSDSEMQGIMFSPCSFEFARIVAENLPVELSSSFLIKDLKGQSY